MKKLMVANWKMNKNEKEVSSFFNEFHLKFSHKRDAWVAPQAIHFTRAHEMGRTKGVMIGLQNCSNYTQGAYTGEISPLTIKESGGHFVIIGHSERRQIFKESSQLCNEKLEAALEAGLKVIYCVGETLAEREANQTISIVTDQLHQGLADLNRMANVETLIIAYEPVWAIGTGKTASPAQAQEVHAEIRKVLKQKFPDFGDKTRILYGGSVKPDNVEELLSQKDIDGGLVGGASLKAKDFLALCGDV